MEERGVECCEEFCAHRAVLDEVREKLPDVEELYDLAELFKVFGDSTRARIICALTVSELCVCDLAALLGMTKSAISHQLAYLKNAKLVKFRREGKNVFYSLDDDHVQSVVEMAVEHLNHR